MEKVKCNTCEQKVMEEEANPHGYYMEGWQCHACTERAEILADEGLTVEEKVKADKDIKKSFERSIDKQAINNLSTKQLKQVSEILNKIDY
tara:strand:- start:750 stop:1022 length:273 start_codon:yes stop_codon:yes gene_type:complete